jgi:hypothetical protein
MFITARMRGSATMAGSPAPLTVVLLTDHRDQNSPHGLASVSAWVHEIFMVDLGRADKIRLS